MSPPRSRALVFTDVDFVGLGNVMVLGVRNGHTRLFLPSAEKAPVAWKSRRDAVDVIIEKRRGAWNSPRTGDATRVRFGLAPCQTCSRNIRAPLNESPRCSGPAGNWRGRWNPRTHTTKPPTARDPSTWFASYSPTSLEPPYTDRVMLSPPSSELIWLPSLPGRNRIWRAMGP